MDTVVLKCGWKIMVRFKKKYKLYSSGQRKKKLA